MLHVAGWSAWNLKDNHLPALAMMGSHVSTDKLCVSLFKNIVTVMMMILRRKKQNISQITFHKKRAAANVGGQYLFHAK